MKEIPLTQGKVALVDDEDYERLSKYKWCAHLERNHYYAVSSILQKDGKFKQFRMHRMVMKVTDPKIKIDHRHGNTLDNRKENIRIATTSENSSNLTKKLSNNTSGYRGVCLASKHKKRNKPWKAYIKKDGKTVHLGYFKTPEEAAKEFDYAAKELFGEFCGRLNFEK